MMQKVFFFLSFLFFFSCAFSQTNNSKLELAEYLSYICDRYEEEEKKMIADTNYLPDPKGEIFTPLMVEYVRKRFLYGTVLGFPDRLNPERQISVVLNDSNAVCRLEDKRMPDAFLNLIQTEVGWRIAGINGEIIQEDQIRYADSLIGVARKIRMKREDIYAVTRDFVRAKNTFSQKGEIDSLALFCTPGYLQILSMGREMDILAEVRARKLNTRDLYTGWRRGDTAIVKLGTYGSTFLYLKKVEGDWKVFGEAGLEGNEEGIQLKKKELELMRKKASLREAVNNELNPILTAYFERGEEEPLKIRSTNSFFQSMERIKLKFGAIRPAFLKVEGFSFPINLDVNVHIIDDFVWVIRHDDTMYFQLENDQWQFAGFNNYWEKPASEAYVEVNYEQLLFVWGISYTAFNDKTQEAYLPEEGEQDTMTYHYMTDFMLNQATPQLPDGLWNYMETQMKTKKRHEKRAPKYVYLSFLVEKDGSLSDMRILSSPRKKSAKKAKEMVAKMPNWRPAEVDDRRVKMYRVLAVPVY